MNNIFKSLKELVDLLVSIDIRMWGFIGICSITGITLGIIEKKIRRR